MSSKTSHSKHKPVITQAAISRCLLLPPSLRASLVGPALFGLALFGSYTYLEVLLPRSVDAQAGCCEGAEQLLPASINGRSSTPDAHM